MSARPTPKIPTEASMHKKLALLTLMNIVMTLSLSGCGSYDNVAAWKLGSRR